MWYANFDVVMGASRAGPSHHRRSRPYRQQADECALRARGDQVVVCERCSREVAPLPGLGSGDGAFVGLQVGHAGVSLLYQREYDCLRGIDVVWQRGRDEFHRSNLRAKTSGELDARQGVYNALRGRAASTGCHQANPSRRSDSCTVAGATTPPSARGHAKHPFSRRFASRQPSFQYKAFSRSPRLPRKRNIGPEYGSRSSTVCTFTASELKLDLMSVTPAAIQIRVPGDEPIIAPDSE